MHEQAVTIARAKRSDLSSVFELLDECKLPKEGLAQATILVARRGERIIGSAALEYYQSAALLRSVAVGESFRGKGLGFRLTKAALKLAKRNRVRSVYLLTETAVEFFSTLGFEAIPRCGAPKKVQGSVEFTTLCPETASVMTISIS